MELMNETLLPLCGGLMSGHSGCTSYENQALSLNSQADATKPFKLRVWPRTKSVSFLSWSYVVLKY